MNNFAKIIHPSTNIGDDSSIGFYSVIGYPEKKGKIVNIGKNCKIGNHVTIYPGVKILDNVSIQDYCSIGEDTIIDRGVCLEEFSKISSNVKVGSSTLVLYNAQIHEGTRIGKNCRIGGFIAEESIIGNYVTVLGNLIHSFRDPTTWQGGESSPTIEDYVVIGFNAIVIGGITISHHVYIAAGAIVSKDVPPNSLVLGINKIVPIEKWKGEIKNSKFWSWLK